MEVEAAKSVALIVGITGMVGLNLAEALKKPRAPGGPWAVYGTARSAKPSWFSSSLVDGYIQFDLRDYEATHRELFPLANQVTHLFWMTFYYCDTEESNIAANSTMLANVLRVLTLSPISPLHHVTLLTGTKQYMGPIFDPVLGSRVVPHESPFREESDRLPFPNTYHALEDLLVSFSPKFTWSVHRSSIIFGASARSSHNILLTFAAYALICRREGSPFRFPGSRFTWEHFCDASDAGLLAEQQIWAATTTTAMAKNQAFNCTNGDVFTWKYLWKVLCEVFDVEFVAFNEGDKFDWLEEMKNKGKVWDAIVEENGLCKTNLEDITCFNAANVVLNFRLQHVCSMTKSREFGFFGFADSAKSVKKWVEKMRDMNIIPKT